MGTIGILYYFILSPLISGTYAATLHHQMAFRVQDHSLDLNMTKNMEEALYLQVDAQNSQSCTHVPKQIPRHELKKLFPEGWISHYEKVQEENCPIHSTEPSFHRKKDGSVEMKFKKDQAEPHGVPVLRYQYHRARRTKVHDNSRPTGAAV